MPDYRIAIGRFWHESNSFCGVTTGIDYFRTTSSYGGTFVAEQMFNQSTSLNEVSGFVEAFRRDGRVEILPTLSSGTLPSGLVTNDAVAFPEETVRKGLRGAGRLDGVCFALHGAMSGTNIDDLDGHFLQEIRDEVEPDLPIVVALDCHAVMTDRMFDLTTAMTAYRTHPHLDLVETGTRATRMLLDVLDGKTRPVVRHVKLPMLFSDPGFDRGPLKGVYETLTEWDGLDGVINCSFCPSFPYQDVTSQGWTAIAVTDNDPALEQRLATDLARRIWQLRHELLPEPLLSPQEAIERAIVAEGRPVLITDPADNIGGGVSGDTTTMLKALMAQHSRIDGLIITHLPDADAIDRIDSARPVPSRRYGQRRSRWQARHAIQQATADHRARRARRLRFDLQRW